MNNNTSITQPLPNDVGYIICEQVSANVEFKVKGEDSAGFIKAEGILQEGNKLNRNRRKYPTEELARNIMSKKIQELVTTGNLKGEAGHPIDTSLARQSKVDPTLEQVWYTKLWMDGDYVMGQFMGTSNQLGQSFNLDLKRGQLPSFSLRAVGSLKNENGELIVAKMIMTTYDRVYYPSHDVAYTQKILTTENTGFDNNERQIVYTEANQGTYFADKQDELNLICESGNSITSDLMINKQITSEEFNNYILSESSNIAIVKNNFDLLFDTMSINESLDLASIKTKEGSIVNINLEDAIKRELIFGINNIK